MLIITTFTTVKQINTSEINFMHYIHSLDVPAKCYFSKQLKNMLLLEYFMVARW